MTVQTTQNRADYNGNGVTTTFAVPFRFLLNTDLAVIYDDGAGSINALSYPANYSVSGARAPGGGSITLTSIVPGVLAKISILRNVPETQLTDYIPNDPFPAESHEDALDKLTMLVQQQQEEINRSLKYPPQIGSNGTIPAPDGTAQVVGFLPFEAGPVLIPLPDLSAGIYDPDFTNSVDRTVAARLRDIVSGKDFGAVGNGVADDSAAINAAISYVNSIGGGTVYLPRGVYVVSGLLVRSNVRLLGDGAGTILRAPAGMGANTTMLTNQNFSSYTDVNIALENLVFDGNGAGKGGGSQSRFASLVTMTRVTGVSLVGVTVRNVGYIGAAIGSCRRVLVDGCNFTDCGWDGSTSNAGPALWCASATTDYPTDYRIVGCDFFDNRWTGLHIGVRRGTVTGCNFYNNQENHIFGSYLLPNSISEDIVIDGNTFDTVRKRDISSHAIEIEAHRLVISNNVIRNCDHGGIALTNARDAVISNNVIGNLTQLSGVGWGGIDFICSGVGAEKLRNITVTGNRVYDDQGVVTTRHAVRFIGAGDNAENVTIADNDFSGVAYLSGVFDLGARGAGSFRRNNLGATSTNPAPRSGAFQPGTSTGALTISGLGFRPRAIQFAAVNTSPTVAASSICFVGADGAENGVFTATDGTNARGSVTSALCWNIVSPATGTSAMAAEFTAFTDDGFTVNITAAALNSWVTYIAYP